MLYFAFVTVFIYDCCIYINAFMFKNFFVICVFESAYHSYECIHYLWINELFFIFLAKRKVKAFDVAIVQNL